jgi:hypothetical protein
MIGGHVNQTIKFYETVPGELRICLDDGATEGRMVVDRIATDEDKAKYSPQYAAFLRMLKPKNDGA